MKQKKNSKDMILILIASFFYFSSPMLVTPLITGFAGSIGASGAVMGIIGGFMNLCSLFCRPLAGNLADRISKYSLSFIGAALMSVSCLGYIFASRTITIILSRLINGIGFACCSVCMSTWMSNMLPKEKIGSGMGFYGMMNALAMAAAPAIGIRSYQLFGYRFSFCLALIFSVATMTLIQFIHDKGLPAADSKSQTSREPLKIADKKVLPIALIIMLFAIPYCATQSFLVNYAEARHLSITVSLFFPLYAAILLILRFSLKSLFDRLPFRIFLFGGALSALLSITSLSFMRNNLVMFAGAFFMAGGYGIMCSVCQSTAILLAGKEHRGLANSTYYIGLDLGMTLGPVIGGFLYGNVPLHLFYPIMLFTIPLELIIWFLAHKTTRLL